MSFTVKCYIGIQFCQQIELFMQPERPGCAQDEPWQGKLQGIGWYFIAGCQENFFKVFSIKTPGIECRSYIPGIRPEIPSPKVVIYPQVKTKSPGICKITGSPVYQFGVASE